MKNHLDFPLKQQTEIDPKTKLGKELQILERKVRTLILFQGSLSFELTTIEKKI